MSQVRTFKDESKVTEKIPSVAKNIEKARNELKLGDFEKARSLILNNAGCALFDPILLYGLAVSELEKVEHHLMLADFIGQYKEEIKNEYARLVNEPGGINKTIRRDSGKHFVYWDSGFENAPELVQKCIKAWRKKLGHELIELNNSNLHEYVEVEEFARSWRGSNITHFSDYLRLVLLNKYGGFWIDSTTYPGDHYVEHLEDLSRNYSFFVPRRKERTLASSYIYASSDSYVVKKMLAAMTVYMQNFDKHIAYFAIHYFFGVLTLIDLDFRAEFLGSIDFSARDYQILWRRREADYDKVPVAKILDSYPVQKLSYKFKVSDLPDNSVLATFLRNGCF